MLNKWLCGRQSLIGSRGVSHKGPKRGEIPPFLLHTWFFRKQALVQVEYQHPHLEAASHLWCFEHRDFYWASRLVLNNEALDWVLRLPNWVSRLLTGYRGSCWAAELPLSTGPTVEPRTLLIYHAGRPNTLPSVIISWSCTQFGRNCASYSR